MPFMQEEESESLVRPSKMMRSLTMTRRQAAAATAGMAMMQRGDSSEMPMVRFKIQNTDNKGSSLQPLPVEGHQQ